MITKKTVLILGAGASQPYGFPTARDLKTRVLRYDVDRIIKSGNPGPLWSYLFDSFSQDKCLNFYNAFRRSGKQSVDAFLEHRYEFLEIGKGLISVVLISCEDERSLFTEHYRWYEYFYGKLNTRFDDFYQNNISVITFNYDRSIEHYLLTTIQNDYGKTEEDAVNVLKSIPIIHLHGKLGDLPALTDGNGRAYSPIITPENLEICIENIKIIHEGEGIEGDPEFSDAYRFLSDAEVVCFLGFGYDKTNLDRLKVQEIFNGQKIFCSSYGLTHKECMHASNYIQGDTEIDYDANDVLGCLRKFTPLD